MELELADFPSNWLMEWSEVTGEALPPDQGGMWVYCGRWARQDVQDGEYDYSHLAVEHGPMKALILGTSFAHISTTTRAGNFL